MGLFSSSSSTTNNNPIADLQASYLPGIYQAATDLYNQGAPSYYPGSTVAGFDPVRAQGLNLGIDAALGAQTDLAQGQTDLLTGILGGTDAYTNQLAQQAATAAGGNFANAGTFGGARHAQAATDAAANAIADRQLQAAGQVGAAQQSAATPAQTLANVGATSQQYAQNVLDADKARYDYTQTAPWQHLGQYQQVVTSPSPGAYSQGTTTSQSPSLFSSVGKLFGFAEGGDVNSPERLENLGTAYWAGTHQQPQQVTRPQPQMQQPQAPTQQLAPGVYSPVETQPTTYEGTDWQRPGQSHGWAIIDGRYQYVPSTQGSTPGGYGAGHRISTPTIGYDVASDRTRVATNEDGSTVYNTDRGVGQRGGTGWTTYGGSQTAAHDNVINSFAEYGKQVADGTANPSDNPAYNPDVAAKWATQRVNLGGGKVKEAKDLTSADFQTEDFQNLTPAQQYAAQMATLGAAGIGDIGGGYNMDDPTSALQDIVGGVKDIPNQLKAFGQGLKGELQGIKDKFSGGLLSPILDRAGKVTSLEELGDRTSPNNLADVILGGNYLSPDDTRSQAERTSLAKDATANWVNSNNDPGLKSDDPRERHEAMQAQAQASRDATKAIREASGWGTDRYNPNWRSAATGGAIQPGRPAKMNRVKQMMEARRGSIK